MKASPAAVGGFVLGGLTLAVLAILFFGGMRLFTPALRAVVFFPTSVAGLTVGSPVTFRGVQVGSVKKIALRLNVTDRSSVIPTFLELDSERISWDDAGTAETEKDPGIPRLVRAGLRAALSSPNLVTGQLQIDLNFLPDTPTPPRGPALGVPEIPSVPSALQNLKDKLTDLPLRELVDEVRATLAGIQAATGAFAGQAVPLADSARQTAEAAREAMRATTEAVRALSGDAKRTLAHIDALAIDGRKQVLLMGQEARALLATAQRATHSAETLMTSLSAMAAPQSPERGDLDAALRDLAASASSLRDFTRDLERSPVRALKGRSSP